MAEKVKAEKMGEVFGSPTKVNLFTDGQVRVAYPITMRNFAEFLENMSQVNPDKLWANFMFEENKEALLNVFKLTFKDVDIDTMLDVVNAMNFSKIMEIVMKINGIDFKLKEDGEDGKNEKEV
jgi:hypothetical protein